MSRQARIVLIWICACVGVIATIVGVGFVWWKLIGAPSLLTRYQVDQTAGQLSSQFDRQSAPVGEVMQYLKEWQISATYPLRNSNRAIIDYWNNPVFFALKMDDHNLIEDVICISAGRDGVIGTADDIRSDRGRWISLPAQPQP